MIEDRTSGGPLLPRRFRPAEVNLLLQSAGVRAAPARPRVLLAGRVTALDAPGGGETQMLAMARHLPEAGVDARFWRPWEDALEEAELLHLFGTLPEFLPLVAMARRHNVRVALSTIAWYDAWSVWREPRPLWRRSLGAARFLVRWAAPALPSWRRRLYQQADLLLPNSQAEATQLMRFFQVAPERIHVVPNGAEERFAEGSPLPFARLAGRRNFVLYAGRIEPRKNQLAFLRAMRGTGLPIVILGDGVPGHEAYLSACRAAADENVTFIPHVPHDAELLASAYAACGCLVLASHYETPGLVAIEAALQGTPLVLPAHGAAREYFGGWAEYVEPGDLRGIREKTTLALARPRSPALARMARRLYSWRAAAAATRDAYERVL